MYGNRPSQVQDVSLTRKWYCQYFLGLKIFFLPSLYYWKFSPLNVRFFLHFMIKTVIFRWILMSEYENHHHQSLEGGGRSLSKHLNLHCINLPFPFYSRSIVLLSFYIFVYLFNLFLPYFICHFTPPGPCRQGRVSLHQGSEQPKIWGSWTCRKQALAPPELPLHHERRPFV